MKIITIIAVCILSTAVLKAQENQIEFKDELEMLGKNINSGFSDAEPKLSPDGTRLYFCRRSNPDNIGDADIWYSEMHKTGEWLKAVNQGRPVNNESFNQLIGIRADGNAMVILGNYQQDNPTNVYISKRISGKWTNPEPMTIKNSVQGTSYGITPDFQTLIISKKESLFDTEDLFVAFRTGENSWSEPVDMGTVINTENAETFPTIASDGKTLYFSSDGHDGFGGYDIFIAKRLDSTWTKWSEPLNIGDKINTSGYDADFTVDARGEYAYVSSNADAVGNEFNIYRIKLPEEARPDPVVILKGNVYEKGSETPLVVKVTYNRLSDGKNLGTVTSNAESGGYKIVLPYGEKYSITAEAKGYAAISDNIDLSTIDVFKEITKDLYLVQIEAGSIVRMNNLFFDTGQSKINSNSYVELNNVVKMLKENPGMKIEINGHTDNVGSDETNMKISEARAKTVANYIIGKGIDAQRIKHKGYGEKKPVASNSTIEGKRKNRRVEFKILEK